MYKRQVAGLFNPATAAQTVSDSTSIVGIAVMSKDYFQAGLVEALEFMAMISVSLGIMNLLPIPPLDGGRFVVEIFQKGTRKTVSQKAMNYMSLAGMALFLGFFVIMPVSYTHLDVYKRQVLRGAEESTEPIGAYQIAGEPVGLLFAGHVDIEGFEAHIGLSLIHI